MLLETMPQNRVQLDRPFKFQRYWLLDLSFPQVVSQAWRQPAQLHEAIKKFAIMLLSGIESNLVIFFLRRIGLELV